MRPMLRVTRRGSCCGRPSWWLSPSEVCFPPASRPCELGSRRDEEWPPKQPDDARVVALGVLYPMPNQGVFHVDFSREWERVGWSFPNAKLPRVKKDQ